ncbi:hypothetical protein K1W54_08555 [Micromonospora sp. CPCC 205371]|nr:hypothetical protein [Micromonospora sp. CPCC 205371]
MDTTGLPLIVLVTAAGVQDRDAARALLWALRTCFVRVVKMRADAGYAGPARRLGRQRTRPGGGDRAQARRPGRVPGPAPQMGRGEDALVDHPLPAHRPRLRARSRAPRRDGAVGHGHRHDPTPGPLLPHRTTPHRLGSHRLTWSFKGQSMFIPRPRTAGSPDRHAASRSRLTSASSLVTSPAE